MTEAATSNLDERHATLWGTRIGLIIIHAGALAALWPGFFSWSALAVMFVLWYLTGAIGISLCYHRTLTHRSLKLFKPLEYAAALLGTLALEGGPITWVATHRIHHAYTDKEGDPHDAHRGLLWTHIDWLYRPNEARPSLAEEQRYAPDLWNDPTYRFLDKYAVLFQVLLAAALFLVGGLPWVIWGVFVRLVVVYHITWLVNSAAHRFGYRSFRTGDQSTNCWWVALLTWGEGWHNNHHAFPFSARHGLKWYEFDLSWFTIRLLKALRLAQAVRLPTTAMLERLQAQRPQQQKAG
ncbi:MAG TPA: fatty acid desaturase [Candidatus Eremiobacteraceae bacterium]|nr:fatty acid desaturase [Candidatus Eremiobacteraceae bacterium]